MVSYNGAAESLSVAPREDGPTRTVRGQGWQNIRVKYGPVALHLQYSHVVTIVSRQKWFVLIIPKLCLASANKLYTATRLASPKNEPL